MAIKRKTDEGFSDNTAPKREEISGEVSVDEEPAGETVDIVEVPEVPSAREPAPTTKTTSATEAVAVLRKLHDAQKEAQAALEGTKFRTAEIAVAKQSRETAIIINDLS